MSKGDMNPEQVAREQELFDLAVRFAVGIVSHQSDQKSSHQVAKSAYGFATAMREERFTRSQVIRHQNLAAHVDQEGRDE